MLAGLLTLEDLQLLWGAEAKTGLAIEDLPVGNAPAPLTFPHFPNLLYAYVWRNWQLVPAHRLANVIGAEVENVQRLASDLGLGKPPQITSDQQQRSYVSVLRRNWHLLPYDQLLTLLGWTPEQLLYTLRYDDGVFWKFGSLKPACERLSWKEPTVGETERAHQAAAKLRAHGPPDLMALEQPLFDFVRQLSTPPASRNSTAQRERNLLAPRFCYSYFAPYGDPLLDPNSDPYPDGYLARLAEVGVDGVWLHVLLRKLAKFPWDAQESENCEQRLEKLRELVARAKQHGVGIYLYLNEPRALPESFFAMHPELKGYDATRPWELGTATLCTSVPAVQDYLRDATEQVCRAVPDLAGFFTITASESLTNCWCHNEGKRCPRCNSRTPAEVIAEVNQTFYEGICRAKSSARLIVWDWGWADWAPAAIAKLPIGVDFMSVSEWDMPIARGGINTRIGEYSLSVVGPGPRATKHWQLARQHGLRTIAKVQVNATWELSAIPYLPVVANVARHAANLRDAGVNGLMLSWSVGGYPSPNFEVVAEIGRAATLTPEDAMRRVAEQRFGEAVAPAIVQAWHVFSAAFEEFPFGSGIYDAPMQFGPANLLYAVPTHYAPGPVAFPYDNLEGWCKPYSADIYTSQFDKVARGFENALAELKRMTAEVGSTTVEQRRALDEQLVLAEAATIHFRSTANQCRFVRFRDQLATVSAADDAKKLLAGLETSLQQELQDARRLAELQLKDSRIGFEASNHYYYVPVDLGEKILNCLDLLDNWLPEQRGIKLPKV